MWRIILFKGPFEMLRLKKKPEIHDRKIRMFPRTSSYYIFGSQAIAPHKKNIVTRKTNFTGIAR